MYETFFDLQHRPFPSVPASDYYIPFDAIESARMTIERVIDRAEGPALLMAPAGMGKTLLCHLVAKRFRDEFSVALLANTKLCSRRALLQNILFELNLPFRDMEEGELRLSLMDFLEPESVEDRGLLLIVDEAHTIPLPLLEELRLITNFVRNGEPRVRLLLSGSAKLEERFAHPRMASFQQRVAARCYLHGLTSDEVREYIQGQLFRAGPGRVEFTEEAYRAVFSASDGIPRLINQICDHTLLLASVGGVTTIDAAGVEEAWADLQQLPTPWTSDEAQTTSEHFIEFGSLDDDPFGAADEPTELDPVEDDLRLDADAWSNELAGNGDDEPLGWEEEEKPETDLNETEVHADVIAADTPQLTDQSLDDTTPPSETPADVLASSTISTLDGVQSIEWLTGFSCVIDAPASNLDAVEWLLREAVDLPNAAAVDEMPRAQTPIAESSPAATSDVERPDTTALRPTIQPPAAAPSVNATDLTPEIESPVEEVVPLASDPFGGDFQEETVVFDPSRYSGPDRTIRLAMTLEDAAHHGSPLPVHAPLEVSETPISADPGRVSSDSSLGIDGGNESGMGQVVLPDAVGGPQVMATPAPALQAGFDLNDGIVLPFSVASSQLRDKQLSIPVVPVDVQTDVEGTDPGTDRTGEIDSDPPNTPALASEHVAAAHEPLELDLQPTRKPVTRNLDIDDDRDLLIIEENPTDIVVSAPVYEPGAKRCEYPQLFDSLRQES